MSDPKNNVEIDSDDEEVVVKPSAVKEPEVVEDTTLANPDVVTKYQEAAKIVQAALVEISAKVRSNSCFCNSLCTTYSLRLLHILTLTFLTITHFTLVHSRC